MPFSIEVKDIVLVIIGAGLGYLMSLIVAKQTERKKNLLLEVVGREIVLEDGHDLPFHIVAHDGERIGDVYLFAVRIWNKGGIQIMGDEISPSAPLGIEIHDSAKVIGEPRVIKPNDGMEFFIEKRGENKFEFGFDCLNSDEWVQVGFFVTGNPRAAIKGSGRIFGQHADFDISTDDSKAKWHERIMSLAVFVLIVSSPFSLVGSIYWAYSEYNIYDFIGNPQRLPKMLTLLFCLGVFVPIIAMNYFGGIWLKRRANPKGYPIREDFEPSQWKSLKSFLMTAISGKSYRVSASMHDYGEIKPIVGPRENRESEEEK
jgi:hypothetical protein